MVFKYGFKNCGSTCFFNTVLYLLFHIILFQKEIIESSYEESNVLNLFKNSFINMNENLQKYKENDFNDAIDTGTLIDLLYYDRFEQQDFNEVLLNIINNYISKDPILYAVLHDCLFFEVIKQITMHNGELIADESMHLLLDLSIENYENLKDSLFHFSDSCHFDFSQEGNSERDIKEIHQKILKSPKILLINLQRVIFKEMQNKKILKYFPFPEILDISPITLEETQDNDKNIYNLKGIIIHSGLSANSGHYYSYYKHKNTWIEFNDNIITRADILNVFNNGYSNENNCATFLIYLHSDFNEVMLDNLFEFI